jgi:hypothetical protein
MLTLTIGLLTALGAADAVAEGLPRGMVFFVASSQCPTGSSPAQNAAGRIIISTMDSTLVNKTQGTPMANLQDNTHTHSGSMTVNLPLHEVSGAASCCNGQATANGTHTANITSGTSTTELPFIQLLVCVAN